MSFENNSTFHQITKIIPLQYQTASPYMALRKTSLQQVYDEGLLPSILWPRTLPLRSPSSQHRLESSHILTVDVCRIYHIQMAYILHILQYQLDCQDQIFFFLEVWHANIWQQMKRAMTLIQLHLLDFRLLLLALYILK